MLKLKDLFTWSGTLAAELFDRFQDQEPWLILPEIKAYIQGLQARLSPDDYLELSPDVYVHRSAKIAPSAVLQGPTIIGPGVEIRPNSFIRATALVESDSLIGYTCELKNVIILPKVQVAHFNYCGDSILGQHSHLACGAITSNVKSDKSLVVHHDGDQHYPTGLKKFGALVGDGVEIGCNTVLNPGTIIGKNARVYPLSSVRGTVPANYIYKQNGEITKIRD